MTPEHQLAAFIQTTDAANAPQDVVDTAKRVILTVFGTAIAGARQDGIEELRSVLLQRAGQAEATSWVFGDRLPASSAAFLNGSMARALDYCDAMKPGLHMGSSVVPAAMAVSESVGGCSGREFLSAVIVGLETGARLNLSEAQYNGLDPTGVAGLMAATAAAARIAGLTEEKTVHALALAFNRCGGSFQSNIDGSLAVRLIQGWVSQMAVECVELAQAGLTGPHRFLSGTYGYMRLFGHDADAADSVCEGLGATYRACDVVFKKYPSCGLTQGVTELALSEYASPGFDVQDIESIQVHLPPYAHRLVGHLFEMGDTPRVDAQFSAQYCVANALVRGGSRLQHFEPEAISDARVAKLMDLVHVAADPELDRIGHTAVRMVINRKGRPDSVRTIDIAPGFPGNPLTDREHSVRFWDCLGYAVHHLSPDQGHTIEAVIAELADLADARWFADQLSSLPLGSPVAVESLSLPTR
jgi:2-methylcitrate dehydratase PrpD